VRPTILALLSAGCIYGGALVGMAVQTRLPPEQRTPGSQDAIKMTAGVISLMAALVLGLLVSSAKNNFDSASAAITRAGARVIMLDRVLAQYGAESAAVRDELRRSVAAGIELLWPEVPRVEGALKAFERTNMMERMLVQIRALEPRTDAQRALREQAQALGNELLLSRWLQIEQAQIPLPRPFLHVLLFWFTMLFASFGLVAPPNATVRTVLFVGAAALGTAIFLILEMNDPMDGIIKVSGGPMVKALEQLQ
jgi:hypothetical protein